MSGTSLDGVDAALLRTDGELMVQQLGWSFVPYPQPYATGCARCSARRPMPPSRAC